MILQINNINNIYKNVLKSIYENELEGLASIFDDNDTSWQDHECERCKCEKETSKEKEVEEKK